jgi:hypothetical protein
MSWFKSKEKLPTIPFASDAEIIACREKRKQALKEIFDVHTRFKDNIEKAMNNGLFNTVVSVSLSRHRDWNDLEVLEHDNFVRRYCKGIDALLESLGYAVKKVDHELEYLERQKIPKNKLKWDGYCKEITYTISW